MDEGRRKELEKLFIMDPDDAWRTRLSPEEALLIALWDRQFACSREKIGKLPDAQTQKNANEIFTRKNKA
mgnify:CR=1 FL=1